VYGGSDIIPAPEHPEDKHVTRTEISAGVCGFHTKVQATSPDMQFVALDITSDCEKIRTLASALKEPVDAYQEIADGHDGVIQRAVRAHITGCCAGCVVPSGIFKSVQVAGGVALPAPVSYTIEKT
jgi:hypothetical protein